MGKIRLKERQLIGMIMEALDEMPVYHGSSYDFNKFNHKKYINTGCGSQSFGWGSYVTDDIAIGNDYANLGNDKKLFYKGKDISEIDEFAEVFSYIEPNKLTDIYLEFKGVNWDIDDMINTLLMDARIYRERVENSLTADQVQKWKKEMNDYYNLAGKLRIMSQNGDLCSKAPNAFLYTVDIPDDNGNNYIDWYSEFPPKFMERVILGLRKLGQGRLKKIADANYPFGDMYRYLTHPNFEKILPYLCKENDYHTFFGSGSYTYNMQNDGRYVYRHLQKLFGSDKAASLFLMNLCGFDGIKYETGTRWDKPDGASEDGHNYVIFDANKLKITGKEKK